MLLQHLYESASKQAVIASSWFKELNRYGEAFFVGGSVRDEILGGIPSKDIDLVVRKIPIDKLISILRRFGKVNQVGKSFGVIKFLPNGESEDIDIALPRTETKTGAGHKGFDIQADPNLSLRHDLERRDFTINAIAKDKHGNTYDPFGGQEDAKRKIIRAVSEKSFKEDPLRMLRAVQFAARFGFTIEPKTLGMIRSNASSIKQISGERILIEFDKILMKGDPFIGAKLLKETGLLQQITGSANINPSQFKKVKTIAEFVYLLSDNPVTFWKNSLKGDINTSKEINALVKANEKHTGSVREHASAVLALADVSKSALVPGELRKAMDELRSGAYPKSVKELAINGMDVQVAGYSGSKVGEVLRAVLNAVYDGKVRNEKNALLDFINKTRF